MNVFPLTEYREALSSALLQINLNPTSLAYGDPDRANWHYKNLKGFSVGSLYVSGFHFWVGSKIFPDDPRYAEAADAVWHHWRRTIVKNNGSLDEYFFGQRSFCATAYSTLMAVLSYNLGGINSNATEHVDAIRLAFEFLVNDKPRPQSANQSLAAWLAWELMYEDKASMANPFVAPWDESTGAPLEYGSFDLGYGLKCVDLLVLGLSVLKKDGRSILQSQLIKLLSFLDFSCRQRIFAPELGSRGNPHCLLGGLQLLGQAGSQRASALTECFTDTARFPTLVAWRQADEKYRIFFHLTSLFLNCLTELSVREVLALHDGLWKLPSEKPHPDEAKPTVYYKSLDLVFFKSTNGNVLSVSLLRAGNLVMRNGHAPVEIRAEYFGLSAQGPVRSCACSNVKLQPDRQAISFDLQAKFTRTLTERLFDWPMVKGLLGAVLLCTPFVPILRKIIYRLTVFGKSPKLFNLGKRQIELGLKGFEVRDDINLTLDSLYRTYGWFPDDGHSTRVHALSSGSRSFQKV